MLGAEARPEDVDSWPMPLAGPPRSAAELAALYIRRLVFDGHLAPGDRVPQDRIGSALEISRIPVREALIRLDHEGWVSIEHNRGAFVNAFDEAAVVDHYELYGLTHEFAVTRAMRRAPMPDLAAELTTMARTIGEVRDREFGVLVMRFHRSVLDAARSRPTHTVSDALSWLVPGDFFELVPAAAELQRRYVPAIARAVKANDPDRAGRAYRTLMSRTGAAVLAVFEERGLVAPAA